MLLLLVQIAEDCAQWNQTCNAELLDGERLVALKAPFWFWKLEGLLNPIAPKRAATCAIMAPPSSSSAPIPTVQQPPLDHARERRVQPQTPVEARNQRRMILR